MSPAEELRLAQEGLQQMKDAWDRGDYADPGQYDRDRNTQEARITKLERQVARSEQKK